MWSAVAANGFSGARQTNGGSR